jgi:peroxiredoxin
MGQVYLSLGSSAKAIEQFKKLADGGGLAPEENKTVLYLLGTTYLQEEDFESAETVFKRMKEEAGEDEEAVNAAKMALETLDTKKRLRKGAFAIPFPDTTKTISGEKITLEDYKGKVVLLDFWATWCAPCRQEMPNVIRVYEKYHDKGFEIIGVSMDRDRKSLDTYIAENGLTWKQIYDGKNWQSDLGQVYAVRAIPSTFLIDREGKISGKNLRGAELEKAVSELLK